MSNSVYGALSATTVSTIQGTAPYLTFDGGANKATTTDELLGIKLSDGTTYSKATNTSTASNPIELPVGGQSLSDITTLVPSGQTSVSLNSLVNTYNYWGDADGDTTPTATGSLTVSAVDVNGVTVNLSDSLDACFAPYQLTLTSTAGTLSTQHGDPNSTNYIGDSTTYYIMPKISSSPYVCWAQPSLVLPTSSQMYDSGYTAWDWNYGFKPQNLSNPSSNFPTTGANKLYFDLIVGGETAANVISANGVTVNATSGTGVTLGLAAQSANVVRVTLNGPTTAASSGSFSAPTFELYSDSGKTNLIYSFKLSKWFINRGATRGAYGVQTAWCNNFGYNVPTRSDLSNSLASNRGYFRRIGGGLFSEWGITGDYTGSGFIANGGTSLYEAYWTSDVAGSYRYIVYSYVGHYGVQDVLGTYYIACVSP